MSDSRQKAWPKVTVAIVNWNGEKFLKRCLLALQNQTVRPHEIIFVDNASSDCSVAIVREFPWVRLIALDQNTGFARGNNLAIAVASEESEWIALINPDAFADATWLEGLLLSVSSNPTFDVFGSKLVNAADPMILDGVGDAYHVSGLVWRMGHGMPISVDGGSRHPASRSTSKTLRLRSSLCVAENTHEIFSSCAAATLYRRSAFRNVNGFDEDYFCYVEDVDLGFRLRLAGYRCLYVPQSVVHHVGSGTTGGQHSDFSIYHGHRNLVWTFVKDMPGVLFWLLLPLHVALNLVSVIWFALRGQGSVILRAKWDAIKGLPRMWAKRKKIQVARVASIRDIWRMLDKRLIPSWKWPLSRGKSRV